MGKSELIEAVRKLKTKEVAEKTDLKVPDADELDMILEESDSVNYDEFVTAIYKATLDNE